MGVHLIEERKEETQFEKVSDWDPVCFYQKKGKGEEKGKSQG